MRGRAARSLVAGLLLALGVLFIAGCGGDDGAGSEETAGLKTGGAAETVSAAGDEREQLKSHNDSGGGAAQFENARTAGTVVEFGTEASEEEFGAVAAALHGYLDAKEARNWELACQYMSAEAIDSIAQFAPEPDVADCSQHLADFSSGTSPKILRRLAVADVGSVRIQGDQAHALYKGAKGFGFFMPMVLEDGLWKVRALAPSVLP